MADLDKVFFDSLEAGYTREMQKMGKIRSSSHEGVRELARVAGIDKGAGAPAAAPASAPANTAQQTAVKSAADTVKALFDRNRAK